MNQGQLEQWLFEKLIGAGVIADYPTCPPIWSVMVGHVAAMHVRGRDNRDSMLGNATELLVGVTAMIDALTDIDLDPKSLG